MKTSLRLQRGNQPGAICLCGSAPGSNPQANLHFYWARFASAIVAIALGWIGLLCRAEMTSTNQTDLTEVPVEKLMEIEVYSPSKRAEKLSESSAAISVVTADDIKRAGARSIPEALRLVPGLDVAELDAEQWATFTKFASMGRSLARFISSPICRSCTN